MLQYLPERIRISRSMIPEEVSLVIPLTGCRFNCERCWNPILKGNSGKELTLKVLVNVLESYKDYTCVVFEGEGRESTAERLNSRARYVKRVAPSPKTALFTGRETVPQSLDIKVFDYVKTGSMGKKSLKSPLTNQRLYRIKHGKSDSFEDITYKYWKKHEN